MPQQESGQGIVTGNATMLSLGPTRRCTNLSCGIQRNSIAAEAEHGV